MSVKQLIGDCRVQLATLEPESISCCITSPPYYGLRSYGTPDLVWGGDPEHAHEWGASLGTRMSSPQQSRNGPQGVLGPRDLHPSAARTAYSADLGNSCPCGAWLGSLGLEPTPELFIEHLVEVFRAVRRVLRPDGTCWLNLGDSYAGSGNGSNDYRQNGNASRSGDSISLNADKYKGQKPGNPAGYKAKDLIGIPWMAAFALRADGWYLRSDIVWAKLNPMPESVTDRPTRAHEYLFLLSKSRTYYYDAMAIREPIQTQHWQPASGKNHNDALVTLRHDGSRHGGGQLGSPDGRNKRSVWQIATQPFRGAHFAVMPDALVEPCIKAGSSEKGQCPECGAPWVRVVERGEPDREWQRRSGADRQGEYHGEATKDYATPGDPSGDFKDPSAVKARILAGLGAKRTTGWQPSCSHADLAPVPQTILDCFGGSGTVGLVADRLGRNAVLVDLKPSYADMAKDRVTGEAPLFTEYEVA